MKNTKFECVFCDSINEEKIVSLNRVVYAKCWKCGIDSKLPNPNYVVSDEDVPQFPSEAIAEWHGLKHRAYSGIKPLEKESFLMRLKIRLFGDAYVMRRVIDGGKGKLIVQFNLQCYLYDGKRYGIEID